MLVRRLKRGVRIILDLSQGRERGKVQGIESAPVRTSITAKGGEGYSPFFRASM